MTTSIYRTVFACTLLASTALATHPALAELPSHVPIATFDPTSDDYLDTEFTDIGFGKAIAIRNESGFIGIPDADDGGHVAVLNLTATGWQRVATLQSPDPATEMKFGRSLTFRDGVLVVGGRNAAYVFKRSNGAFVLTQTLTPPTADHVTDFPLALRYEAGTLLASGHRRTAPSAVYVYRRDSSGAFTPSATVHASDGVAGDDFGADISMTDRLFVVASPKDFDTGSAYTFRRNSSGNWVQVQKLTPVTAAPGFGAAVAIDRDMILVGAPFVDVEGAPSGPPTPDDHVAGGAVFGFLPGAGGYVESFKLRPGSDERFRYERFGSKIRMSGSRIAVVATGQGQVAVLPDGLVFTYTRDGSSVLPRGIATHQFLVTGVGLSNNALLVGASSTAFCPQGCVGRGLIYDVNRFEQ